MRVAISGSLNSANFISFSCARSSSIRAAPSRRARRIGEVEHRIAAPSGIDSLILRRQEAAAPQPIVERLVVRIARALRDHGDEGRQVAVLAAQPVGEPRADAGPAGELRARLKKSDGRVVIDRLGVHRLDKAQVIREAAVCGSSSLSQAPLAPCRAKRNFEAAIGKLVCREVMPVSRCPVRHGVGKFVAWNITGSRVCGRTGN